LTATPWSESYPWWSMVGVGNGTAWCLSINGCSVKVEGVCVNERVCVTSVYWHSPSLKRLGWLVRCGWFIMVGADGDTQWCALSSTQQHCSGLCKLRYIGMQATTTNHQPPVALVLVRGGSGWCSCMLVIHCTTSTAHQSLQLQYTASDRNKYALPD
jgi:hypothetical protein